MRRKRPFKNLPREDTESGSDQEEVLLPVRSRRRRPAELDAETRSALCTWFGWDPEEVESSGLLPKEELGLEECMKGLLQGMGIEERLKGKELVDQWSEIVGGPIASHAHPMGLQDGVLTIACDHPAWLEELSRFHQKAILRNIADVFGPELVTELRFRIG
jgi:hypothetical protein